MMLNAICGYQSRDNEKSVKAGSAPDVGRPHNPLPLARIFHEPRSPQPQGVARDAVVCYRERAATQRMR